DNLNVGFLVIDGAKNNYLSGNEGGNNGTYDFELAGDTERFGFFTPTSVGNRAIVGSAYTVKDCGLDNVVTGGIKIDTAVEPCN
ncbi:MAG: hypothetical protein HC892_22495, partial [Saprospiraceae bacterium]|nr:hypothetical protein [Saprospiraceae bacterium]